MFVFQIRVPKQIKQILVDLKEKTNSNTITEGEFNTLPLEANRSYGKKINKENSVKLHLRSTGPNRYLHKMPYDS